MWDQGINCRDLDSSIALDEKASRIEKPSVQHMRGAGGILKTSKSFLSSPVAGLFEVISARKKGHICGLRAAAFAFSARDGAIIATTSMQQRAPDCYRPGPIHLCIAGSGLQTCSADDRAMLCA